MAIKLIKGTNIKGTNTCLTVAVMAGGALDGDGVSYGSDDGEKRTDMVTVTVKGR